jgi:hypothetical protein
VVHRVHLPKTGEMRAYRRMTTVQEIAEYEKYREVISWKPANDTFTSSINKGTLLPYLSKRLGRSEEELLTEVERHKNVLIWMRKHNIRSYRDVSAIITEYYSRPKEFYEKRVKSFDTAA